MTAGQSRRVVGRPGVDQPLVAGVPSQDHPARAAAFGLAHRDELRPPPLEGPEITGEGVGERRAGAALFGTEPGKIDFMQDHRIGRDQFLALQPVYQVSGRLGVIEPGQLLGDLIEPFHRAGVVVGVVAGENLFRQTFDLRRVERHRLDVEGHRLWPCRGRGLRRGGRSCGSHGKRDTRLNKSPSFKFDRHRISPVSLRG